MKEVKIKDITIRYDKEEIEEIINIVKNNYSVIYDCLPSKKIISLLETTDEDIEYVSDFDEFFTDIVIANFNYYEKEKKPLEDISTYLLLLINKLDKMDVSHFEIPASLPLDKLYFVMAKEYFKENGTINSLIEHLKNPINKEDVISWFTDKMRYPTYEYLLNEQVKCLESLDFEYLDNINDITERFFEQMVSDLKYNDLEKEEELPDISFEEISALFKEFLKVVKAPEEWLQLYQELKDNGFIYYNEPEEGKTSECYVDKDGHLKIMIYGKGLMAFKILCHEFGHYVSMYKGNKNIKPSISEFPSIFLEYLAIGFLKFKGYNDNILNNLEKRRMLNNFDIMCFTYPILNDIADLYKNKEDFISRKKAKAQKICEDIELKYKIDYPKELSYNPEETLNKEVDFATMLIIKNPTIILESYQYLLGTYLARETVIKFHEDASILNKVFEIINNLDNVNLKDIIEYLNLPDILKNSQFISKLA